MKIFNKNTGAVIYDNQMGASETADPVTPVDQPKADGTDIVVVSNPATTTNITAQNMQMETVIPDILKFSVKVFPNPTEHQFTLVLDGASNEKVQIIVYDAVGRQVKMFEKESANIPIRFGADLKVGAYIVEVRQGDNRKTLKLVKQ